MTPSSDPSRINIDAHQLTKLRSLVSELLAGNAFYQPRLRQAGLAGDDEHLTLEQFREQMPLTTKAELVEDQAAHPPFGTNLTYELRRYTRFHQTSGTTGAPLRWLDTTEAWSSMLGCWEAVFHAAGADRDDRVCFAFSFGPFLGFWTAFEAAGRIGCLCLPAGGLSSVGRLRLMRDNAATVLCCTPTYALRLAEVARAEGFDLADFDVRLIIVAGEPGGSLPTVRQRISDAWNGARVFDHHGMTEVGPVTYECPNRPGSLRVIESSYLAEVIDPESLEPVRPGERGELVLTTLDRVGSPLLRYRTGDLVEPIYVTDDDADGGEHLALAGGILGRVDDMVLVRGVNVYPSAVDEVLRSVEGIEEYRVEIDQSQALTAMRLVIEAEPEQAEQVAGRAASALQQTLSLRVPVRTVAPGELPRFEMKANRWVKVTTP